MSILSHDCVVPSRRFTVRLLAFFLCVAGCGRHHPLATVPDFTLPEVRGGSFHLRAERSPAILLAFLETVPDTADTPSRQQAGFLLSMQRQYGRRGLQVVMIDSSGLTSGESPERDALVNASYDWHLEVPLLADDQSRLGTSLRITQAPTLLLLTSDGTIIERWNGLTGPAALAEAVAKLCI